MVCINCKALLDDDSRFCPICGTRQPEAAPAAPKSEPDATVYAGYEAPAYQAPVYEQPAYQAPVQEQPVYQAPVYEQPVYEAPVQEQPVYEAPVYEQPAYEAPIVEQPPYEVAYQAPVEEQPVYEQPVYEQPAAPAAPAEKKKTSKGLLFGILGVAVVAVVVILALVLGGGSKKSSKGVNMALYIKDEEVYGNMLKGKAEEFELTDRFLDEYDDLGEELDPEVGNSMAGFFVVSEDGKTIFYPDKLSEDGCTLYIGNLAKPDNDPVKIDSSITDYCVSEDSRVVTYLKGESSTAYQYNVKNEEKEKVATDVMEMRVSADASKIIYVNDEGDMYSITNGEDKEKLDSDVEELYDVSEDFKTVYYGKDGGLYKMVNGEDKEKITSDLYGYPRIYESGEVYYVEYEESEKVLADFITDDMAAADEAMTEPEYPDWDDYETEEDYDKAYEEYETAYDEYWAKLERDEIREDMETWTIYVSEEKLYYYNGEDSTLLSENLIYERYAYDKAVVIYGTGGGSGKVKMSECVDIWDAEWQVEEKLSDSGEYFVAQGGESFALEMDTLDSLVLNDDGTMAYFITNVEEEDNFGELHFMKIGDGKIKETAMYDEEVYAYYLRMAGDNDVVYFKDAEDGVGELFMNAEHVDYDVSIWNGVIYSETLDQLVYYVDWDDEEYRGTLKLSGSDKAAKVGDDVADYIILSDGRILYLGDYDMEDGIGELRIYEKGESESLDSDVVALIPVYTASETSGYLYGW